MKSLPQGEPKPKSWYEDLFNDPHTMRAIRFGRMYEDSNIEQSAFARSKRVFCIASAGCTLLSLCCNREVVGCDLNPAQLAYIKRRINGGGEELGRTEHLLKWARYFAPIVGWGRNILREFLALSDIKEQLEFWETKLDTLRFRACFDTVMALRSYRARQFAETNPRAFGKLMRERLRRGFARHPNSTNPYAHAILLGTTEDYIYQPNPQMINLVQADAASYLEACSPGSFDGFTLSNILDGTSQHYRIRLLNAIRYAATNDAVVVLRSFNQYLVTTSKNLAEEDRSLMWGTVFVGDVSSLCEVESLLFE